MPVYYLHVINETLDENHAEGQELASLEGARAEAIKSIRSILSDEIKYGKLNLSGHVVIMDDAHNEVDRVAFAEAIKVTMADQKHA